VFDRPLGPIPAAQLPSRDRDSDVFWNDLLAASFCQREDWPLLMPMSDNVVAACDRIASPSRAYWSRAATGRVLDP
jgi:hypothetical protein